MALTDAEKAEMKQTMAEGIADGLALFRSRAEEEAAKNPPPASKNEGSTSDSGSGFSLAGFLLGGK